MAPPSMTASITPQKTIKQSASPTVSSRAFEGILRAVNPRLRGSEVEPQRLPALATLAR